jgi:hypothetical protein
LNPYTDAADWVVVPPPSGQKGQVYDVQATGQSQGLATAPDDAAEPPAAAASEAAQP